MSSKNFLLKINELNIAVKQWGEDSAPAILALHGWLDNAGTYDRLADTLEGYRLLALDFAGHGLSDHRPAGARYHLLDNVDDVIAVADALNLDRFMLMGHSLGAAIATLLAGAFPQRVTHLILLEGIGPQTTADEQAPDTLFEAVNTSRKPLKKHYSLFPDKEQAIRARTFSFGGISFEAAASLSIRGMSTDSRGFYWHSDSRLKKPSISRMTEPMVEAFLKRLDMPVLLVLGEQSFFANYDGLTNRTIHVDDISVVKLPGNHHFHLEPETYQAVSKAISEFIRSEKV